VSAARVAIHYDAWCVCQRGAREAQCISDQHVRGPKPVGHSLRGQQ
jgi:hypothetical protein